jgi:hypothetical protein
MRFTQAHSFEYEKIDTCRHHARACRNRCPQLRTTSQNWQPRLPKTASHAEQFKQSDGIMPQKRRFRVNPAYLRGRIAPPLIVVAAIPIATVFPAGPMERSAEAMRRVLPEPLPL